MKNKTNYQLVARMSGKSLTITPSLRDDLARQYDMTIASLCAMPRTEDVAMRIAKEMERKGDFLWSCGAEIAALRCYISAIEVLRECRRAYHSIEALRAKALRLAESDEHLKGFVQQFC